MVSGGGNIISGLTSSSEGFRQPSCISPMLAFGDISTGSFDTAITNAKNTVSAPTEIHCTGPKCLWLFPALMVWGDLL